MTEQKMHDTEWQNSKCTIQKMAENACTGKWQKKHTWKMTEQKMHDSSHIWGILNRKKHMAKKWQKSTPGK